MDVCVRCLSITVREHNEQNRYRCVCACVRVRVCVCARVSITKSERLLDKIGLVL